MKKALALVLALVMMLSLCACGQKETTPDNTPSTTGDGTTTVADANKDADIYSWIVNDLYFGNRPLLHPL